MCRYRGGASYTFDIGPKELVNMVGLSASEGSDLIRRMFDGKKLKIMDNKIFVTDVEEIKKQAEYYKKMQQIERSRRERTHSA